MKVNCPVCFSNLISYQGKYRFNHPCFKNLSRVACENCGLHFSNPMPQEQNLLLYNNSYHLSAYGGFNRTTKENAFFSGIAKTRIKFIMEHIDMNHLKPYKVLEIGPGPGVFFKNWMNNFPKSKYFVLETDKNCHPVLKKLGAEILDIKDLEKNNLKFDFLIASQVLEHVRNPLKFLSLFVKNLKKNGHGFIEVPCNDWNHKKIDEPHLLFFDKKPMSMLLQKLNVKPIKISYYGTPIEELRNKKKILLKKVKSYLGKLGIYFYHPERKHLKEILFTNYETEAVLNFDAHKEQIIPSWWLRTIFKNI